MGQREVLTVHAFAVLSLIEANIMDKKIKVLVHAITFNIIVFNEQK